MLKRPGAPVAPTVELAPLRPSPLPDQGRSTPDFRVSSVGPRHPSVKAKTTTCSGLYPSPPTTSCAFAHLPVDPMWTPCGPNVGIASRRSSAGRAAPVPTSVRYRLS